MSETELGVPGELPEADLTARSVGAGARAFTVLLPHVCLPGIHLQMSIHTI